MINCRVSPAVVTEGPFQRHTLFALASKKFMKTIFTILLVAMATLCFAQNFKPFKVGVGAGYAIQSGGKGGGLLFVEPAYRISNLCLIGLRLESAVTSRGITGKGKNITGEATSNASYSINGQYYLNEKYVRPFVGLGLGVFSLGDIEYNGVDGVTSSHAASRFGFYPRVGVDIGHLNLTVDYNVIPRITTDDGSRIRNSYLGLRAALAIGGGVGKKGE